jgi:hypothetical protein
MSVRGKFRMKVGPDVATLVAAPVHRANGLSITTELGVKLELTEEFKEWSEENNFKYHAVYYTYTDQFRMMQDTTIEFSSDDLSKFTLFKLRWS